MNKGYWYYVEWLPKRLTALRLQNKVSARDMSLSIGQCENYINRIETGKSMPSMHGLFYICEYLNITPAEFFSEESVSPEKTRMLENRLLKLTPEQTEHLLLLVQDLTDSK